MSSASPASWSAVSCNSQVIAPIVAWLATEGSGGVSNQIFHAGRGGIGIMQQPAVIKSFSKRKGTWTLDELDRYVPQLIEARKSHDAAVKAAGKSIPID